MALMLENNKAAVNNSYDINVQLEQTDNFYVAKTLERIGKAGRKE